MVRENLIPNRMLRGADAAKRDALIRQSYGIGQDLLDNLRSLPLYDTLEGAAELLYDRGEALNRAGAAQVTGINLAAVATRHWGDAHRASTAVENALAKRDDRYLYGGIT